MALNGYFGRPGSGKSYSVVEYVIIPALTKGRHVVTNIPLEEELLVQVYGGKITQLPLDALDHPDLADLLPNGCVAVLDEVWRRWPSGQKANQASHADLRILKEHRHRVDADGNAMQVVLVTQDPSDLASWVRKLIAHSFMMKKLDTIGAAKRFSIQVFEGCHTGTPPKRFQVREAVGTYRPEIYRFYRSATQSQSSDLSVGDERAMDKRANVWTSGGMITILAFVPLALIGGLWLGYDYVSSKLQPADEVVQVQQPKRIEAPPLAPIPGTVSAPGAAHLEQKPVPVPPPAPSAEPLPSPTWRIVGYIKRKDADAPETAQAWASERGYNVPPEETHGDSRRWKEDQAILRGMAGMRTVSLSACKRFPNSVEYYCDLDGERVTPWTGQQGLSGSCTD
ncbi:zonular occludens toxin domain-containing protein [Glutamicibacter soli]|uniref:zonular occludens toxin domain-containing protein n=1 Tax=Glutamicibacter soli TaxID=453836 RepID=UPI001F2D7E4F|nr:zonular occludens toxin domain-containing protein [Glutamicibacter soli]